MLPAFDEDAGQAAVTRQAQLTRPTGLLRRLEELTDFCAGWRGTGRPVKERAQAWVFAGNHDICTRGVNSFPQEVSTQMVANFETARAAINPL